MPHEYAFDVKLFATVRITAADEATARAQLAETMDGASLSVCHGGVDMPDTFEASMDGEPDLIEVDGEDPEAEDEPTQLREFRCPDDGAHWDAAGTRSPCPKCGRMREELNP